MSSQDKIFIATGSVMNSNRETKYLPEGNWDKLLLEIVGTTDTGETLTLDDVGEFEVVREGEPLQNEDYEFYSSLTDLKFGRPNKPTGSAAQAEELSAFIPFSANGYDNAMMLRNNKEAWLNLSFDAALNTRFGGVGVAGTYTLYGIKAQDTFESYDLMIKSQNFQAQGAGRISETLAARNILSVFIKDESPSVIDTVTLIVGGQTIEDNTPMRTLLTFTNLHNNIEAADEDWAELVVAADAKRAAFNRNSKLEIKFTGAGTAQVVIVSADWLPNSQAQQNLREVSGKLAAQANGQGAALGRGNR